MAQQIIIDRVAIWTPQMADGLMVRKMPAGTAYITRDSMIIKQSTQPIYRYVKNYTAGSGKSKVKFCLFVRSFVDSEKFVEAGLDQIAKDIPADYAKKAIEGASFESFVYTDNYLEKLAKGGE